ncbi:MAG: hypothetical protein Q9220_000341 [cf. Caloplaca sp. 1 TL-2023]
MTGGSAGLLSGDSFGAVHLETIDSEYEAAPAVRAVKTINKRAAEASRIHWQQEVENLIVLSQYPNFFVKIFGWWEDDKSIFLPVEYFEASDLSRSRDYIRNEGEIQTIAKQLAVGLQQMHSLGIIHRDIKPQIGDFGFSKRISDSVSARGTMKYMAPEYRDLMNNYESSDFTSAVDMWSFGCLIYELFARKCPFDETDTQGLIKFVRDGVFPRQPLDECSASSESIWLIMALLEPDPHLRISAQDALHSAWLNIADMSLTREPLKEDPLKLDKNSKAPSGALMKDSLVSTATPPTPAMHHAMSAPRDIVVVPDQINATGNDDASSSIDNSHKPPFTQRAITGPERPLVLFSADDASLTLTKTAQIPDLPVRPRSSNSMRSEPGRDSPNLRLADQSSQSKIIATTERQTKDQSLVARPAAITRKPVAKPSTSSIFPYVKISRLSGDYVDMGFKNLKFKPQRKPTCDVCESRRVFNPVIKPAALFTCKDCDQRPLCARCIVETIRNSTDPHHADHKLQAWIQARSFPLQEFLERFQPLDVQSTAGVDPTYGKSWLSSDYSFTPPAVGSHGTRWILNAPAGEFDISIQVRIAQQVEAIESPALSVHKSMMVKSKAVPLGSILFGARVLDAGQIDDVNSSRHLPGRPIEQSVKLAKEDQSITLKLGFKFGTTGDQKIEVHVRGCYDALYFKAGSPFKWWLDQIS